MRHSKKVKQKNIFLFRDSFAITLFTFIIVLILKYFTLNISLFSHGHNDLEKLQDTFYSKFFKLKPKSYIDPDIVIIDIENSSRNEIGKIVKIVAKCGAKTIGIDVIFNKKDEKSSKILSRNIENFKENIVLTGYFIFNNKGEANNFETSDSIYLNGCKNSFSNFISYDIYSKIQRFNPYYEYNKNIFSSFSVEIVKNHNSSMFSKMKNKFEKSEYINYTLNTHNFLTWKTKEIIKNSNKLNLKDKIVLIGKIGDLENSHSNEDYHYTPISLNPNIPDMPGTIIHANIIRMILDNKFINEFSQYWTTFFSFLVTLLHVIFYLKYKIKQHYFLHFYFKVSQLISISFVFFVCIITFFLSGNKINLGIFVIPIALCVDSISFFEEFSKWLKFKFNVKTYFSEYHEH